MAVAHGPGHLRTRRQLAAEGLRPGGQEIAGQVLWNSRRYNAPGGVRAAYLYDVRFALPKRVPSERQRIALGKALAPAYTAPSAGATPDTSCPATSAPALSAPRAPTSPERR